MDVSVVIATRNAEDRIRVVLTALACQTLDGFEVVVVDDGSDDATAQVAAGFAGVRVVSARRHVGLPAGRNIGLRQAAGGVIAFTDDDCKPDADWLERGLARFSEDPGLTVLAGRVTIPLSDPPRIHELLDAARHFDQERCIRDGYAAGAGLWVRRDAALAIGGFNERLPAYGGDDFEFCRTLGVPITYAPEVNQAHPPRGLRQIASKSYRIGTAFTTLRRFGRVPAPPAPPPWALIPDPFRPGKHRLQERGVRVGPLLHLRLIVANYLFAQLPYLVGVIVGAARRVRS